MLALLGLGSIGVIPQSSGAYPSAGTSEGHDESLESLIHDDGVRDPSRRLIEQDAATTTVVSDGPFAHVTENVEVADRGERLLGTGV